VRQSVTIAREDAGSDKRLVSYVVADDAVGIGELRQHLKQKLPDYMMPSAFVMIDTLPLMPNGKIDRRALPEPSRTEHQPSTTTRTPIEEIVTGICAHLLRFEEVSAEDNFFELGGHSLLATQLISRLRDSLSLEIPLRWVFQTSTLRELAERVEEELAKQNAGQRIEAIRHRDEAEASLPLSFAQQRLWFLDQLEPDNPAYNIPSSIRLTGPLDLAAVSQRLNVRLKRGDYQRLKPRCHSI
jgi:acyl carrier protein